MNEELFKQYVTQTQSLIATMNTNLANVQDAIRKLGEAEASNLKLAASAYDMSFLALRTLSELHVDFRTMLIRFAQEPAAHPAAKENRDLLLNTLAAAQKEAGERPSLKPVPPSHNGP